MKENVKCNITRVLLITVGIPNLLNGLWMLFAPSHWFVFLEPFAKLSDTGPENIHLIGDVGIAYIISSFTLLLSSYFITLETKLPRDPPLQLSNVTAFIGSLFFIGHAFWHVYEILSGRFPDEHWFLDFPPVFLPALLLLFLLLSPPSISLVSIWIRSSSSDLIKN